MMSQESTRPQQVSAEDTASNIVSSDRNYSDQWAAAEEMKTVKRDRVREILSHVRLSNSDEVSFTRYHGEPLLSVKQPRSVLEIGSGLGGVTAAYRELFPDAMIVCVDSDSRARLPAEENNSHFQLINVLVLSQESISLIARLFQHDTDVFDQIVALKTSGEVVRHLLRLVQNGSFASTTVFFSLIEETDNKFFKEISENLKRMTSHSATKFYLHEDRAYHELAWVLTPKVI